MGRLEQEAVGLILQGKSPRYIIENRMGKWEVLGEKIDAIVRTGGMVAAGLGPALAAFAHARELQASSFYNEPSLDAYRRNTTLSRDIEAGSADLQDLHSKYGKPGQQASHSAVKLGIRGATASVVGIGLSTLGMASLFKLLGRLVDRRKTRVAFYRGVQALLADVKDPQEKKEIEQVTTPLIALDPFADTEQFTAKLRELLFLLVSSPNQAYRPHIESIRKFIAMVGY